MLFILNTEFLVRVNPQALRASLALFLSLQSWPPKGKGSLGTVLGYTRGPSLPHGRPPQHLQNTSSHSAFTARGEGMQHFQTCFNLEPCTSQHFKPTVSSLLLKF